jgi:hypothetical protein
MIAAIFEPIGIRYWIYSDCKGSSLLALATVRAATWGVKNNCRLAVGYVQIEVTGGSLG